MSKRYDLEKRTLSFAERVRRFTKSIPKSMANQEDAKQLVRASGSVGANYIEANESLSKRDFIMRIKICRKEAKESGYFLRLIETSENISSDKEREGLIQEAEELTKIFGAILRNSE